MSRRAAKEKKQLLSEGKKKLLGEGLRRKNTPTPSPKASTRTTIVETYQPGPKAGASRATISGLTDAAQWSPLLYDNVVF